MDTQEPQPEIYYMKSSVPEKIFLSLKKVQTFAFMC